MKKQKVIEEVDWMLTDEAKNDPKLNPIDLDVLAILQFIKDGKDTDKNGFFNIILKDGKDIRMSLQGSLKDFGVSCDFSTVSRTVNKLERFGYLEYHRGFYHKDTKSGRWPRIRLIKGTIEKSNQLSNIESECYWIIESTTEEECNNIVRDNKISYCNTEDYSDIAIAQEKEKEKENKKEKLKIKTKEEVKEYFSKKYTNCSWETFLKLNPSVTSFDLPLKDLEDCFQSVKQSV